MRSLYTIILLALLTTLAAPGQSEEPDFSSLIQKMFPKATVIGEKTTATDIPVWPVYQLQHVIGYAFESNDLVDLPGFSGERVNLLIGIDTAGNIAGIELLHHHEPIFLHGLGEKPLLEFIHQFVNQNIAHRFIVGRGTTSDTGTVYLDGVTKATVSVIIVNDTIINSALKVARAKLEDFAKRAPAAVKQDYFETHDWPTLISSGMVKRWELTRESIEDALGSSLDDFTDPQLYLDGAQTFVLYFAYLNLPSVGRNLLGAEEHQALMSRLKPGEQAIAVMSEGMYSYLDDEFRPGTVPERIGIIQNGLPIGIRDTNFYDGNLALMKGAPRLDDLRVFRIRPQTGFDPSAPMQIQLSLKLAKNHLVSASASLTDDYRLPARFFEKVEIEEDSATPVWVMIWQSRSIEIGILLLALCLVSWVFVKQHRVTRHSRRFHVFRWSFLFFTLFFIGFYAQGQLSVVNIFTLLLELVNGFDIGMFLLDPVIFILWLFTFVSLFVFGRGLFCGWLCPFGALQEMTAWLAKRLRLRQIHVPERWHRHLLKVKYGILLLLVVLSFYSLGLAEKAAEIEPFKTAITLVFVRSWPFVVYAMLLLLAGMFIHKFYCRYLCPLGAGLAVLGKLRLFEWLTRRQECGSPCQLCHHRCEIGAIDKRGNVDYDECIQCLECIVILHDNSQCAPARLEKKKSLASNPASQNSPVQWVEADSLGPVHTS